MSRDPETGRHDPNARLFAANPRGASKRAGAHVALAGAPLCQEHQRQRQSRGEKDEPER
jgi:hypothetical protein